MRIIVLLLFCAAIAAAAWYASRGREPVLAAQPLVVPDAAVIAARSTPLPPEPPVEMFDRSTLPITLIGTIVRANPSASVATLHVESFTQSSHESDPLQSIAILKRIERDQIVIQNLANGHDEVVLLPSYVSTGSLTGRALSDRLDVQVRRSDIDHQLENITTLLRTARAVPVLGADGAVQGFRIEQIDPRGFFASALGLKSGDVLTAVNGTKLDSVEAAVALYNELRQSSMIEVGLTRGGKPIRATYLIR